MPDYNIVFSDAQEDTVRAHFQECGQIDNVRLIRDNFSGMGKGIGYVIFKVFIVFSIETKQYIFTFPFHINLIFSVYIV